jgi:hypothetical protein
VTTDQGFVQSIDVARGGLVTVHVLLTDGSVAVYVISDLDADPERFNERLSKLALLRDAMNRAEPVEIDHDKGPAGEEIERAERITRDAFGFPVTADAAVGLVAGLLVHSRVGVTPDADSRSYAEVVLLGTNGQQGSCKLDLQFPERPTVIAQLGMLQAAYAAGTMVRVLLTTDDNGQNWILEVAEGGDIAESGGKGDTTTVSGFVESLSLIPLTPPAAGNLASAGFTTAPEFTGPGGTVDPGPFSPSVLTLLVAEGSLTYKLIKTGLQDGLRMQVAITPVNDRQDAGQQPGQQPGVGPPAAAPGNGASPAGAAPPDTTGEAAGKTFLCSSAKLLAPLASASRPVWIRINREMLDRGPDGDDCVAGVPTSDLTPATLRDLGIPYAAIWCALGCFNHGVYRFQITTPAGARLKLDDRPLCLYPTGEAGIQCGYACIEGDHEVCVEIEDWTCTANFAFDAYRIR